MAATQADKPEFVLFMMVDDRFCLNFINKLKTKPDLMKKVNIVDIDSIPAIPNEVDEVPCLYDGKGLFKGKKAFEWLNEKMSEFLGAANDGLMYSFIDGQEEQIFGTYSLLEQRNGSFGMSPDGGGGQSDPTRMTSVQENTNKNTSLESLMATRNQGIDIPGPGGQKQNLNCLN
jgi:hypothetical protein